uniref:G-protein coupled receptors family 1 profile domain-containing protein n=1 Tax=Ascaris lumbricoides TaxID=6252 RepID=A0A9J2PXU7_ASCLU
MKISILEELPQDVTVGDQWPPIPQRQIHLYGLCLIVIPTVTILGNLLVILSVLRFKALHSAINFLILGLAVADLFVALFVMPYAVYIYVEGGYWFLGPLMCDIYSACDVACSTASILLLSVISFDRYRAVSRPIQYSRQSQNVRRVIYILIVIWLISLIVASPIVLGSPLAIFIQRPEDKKKEETLQEESELELVAQGVVCGGAKSRRAKEFLIIAALRAREKAAKLRRMTHANKKSCDSSNKLGAESFDNAEDPGGIVAAPGKLTNTVYFNGLLKLHTVNMMMLALPSMTRRMHSYEQHRAAIDHAGTIEDEEEESDEEELSDSRPDNSLSAASALVLAGAANSPLMTVGALVRSSGAQKHDTEDSMPAKGNVEAQHANMRLVEHPRQRNKAGMISANVLSATNAHNCMYAESSQVVNYEEVDVQPPLLTANSPLMLRRFLLNEAEGDNTMMHVECEQQLASSLETHRKRIRARMDMRRWHSADMPSCFILSTSFFSFLF